MDDQKVTDLPKADKIRKTRLSKKAAHKLGRSKPRRPRVSPRSAALSFKFWKPGELRAVKLEDFKLFTAEDLGL